MKQLAILTVLLGALWSGYWLFGARSVERETRAWFDARAQAGWVANQGGIATAGFPNRYDTTITDPELADPATGLAWSGTFLQLLRLSYRPNHIIAVFPARQVLATPRSRIDIAAGSLRASLRLDTDRTRRLLALTAEGAGLAFSGPETGALLIDKAVAATRQTAAAPLSHDISVRLTGLRPDAALRARLDPAGLLPETFDTATLDATLAFDAPWDRRAIEATRPQITALKLKLAQVTWGALDLRLAGDLAVGRDGLPEGRIVIKAENWRDILALARDSGQVSQTTADLLEPTLDALSRLSGNPRSLDVPLDFRAGRVSLGPLPLGRAPRLVLP